MRAKYVAAGEIAEIAAKDSKKGGDRDYFNLLAAEYYKAAEYLSKGFEDYESAQQFRNSSIKNYGRIKGSVKEVKARRNKEIQLAENYNANPFLEGLINSTINCPLDIGKGFWDIDPISDTGIAKSILINDKYKSTEVSTRDALGFFAGFYLGAPIAIPATIIAILANAPRFVIKSVKSARDNKEAKNDLEGKMI